MSKLTDEQIEAIYKQETGALIDDSPWALVDFSRAIEAAATEPLLQRIAELEAANEAFAKRQEWWNKRMVELERQLEESRKDAERWKMTIEIGQDVLRHPDCRKIPASVSAYMDAIHKGYDMTYAVDAAIDAAMKGQP